MKLYGLMLARVIAVLCLLAMHAFAGVIVHPGDATACCGVYDAGTTAFVLPGPDLTAFSSLTSGGETLTFLNSLVRLSVPTLWATWSSPPQSETATPVVGYDSGNDTLSLSLPVQVFGFELEPADLGVFNYTVNFFNNTTSLGSIALPVDGNSGAVLFAMEVAGNQINNVTISGNDSGGFALANIRFAQAADTSVPEPGSSILMLLGGTLIGAVLRFLPRRA